MYDRIDNSLKVGDELNLKIKSIGSKGDGIARHEDCIVFVPDVQIGDEVTVNVTTILGNKIFTKKAGGKNEAVQNRE